MNNKQGFTLIELLAVIVILGVITGISIPLIRNLQQTMTEKKYTAYLTSLKTSAKLYNDAYSEDLFGHNETGVVCLTYEELEKKNLLKDIGIDDISCNHSNTFVRITKLKDKYVYVPYLTCGKEENGKVKTIEKVLPEESTETMTDEFCKQDVSSTIIITADKTYISNKYDKKRRKTSLTISSVTGIYNKIILYTAWSKYDSPPSSGWELTSFKVIGNQKEKILNGETITTTSKELITPKTGDGLYYLFVRVDNLQDLYGNKWTSSSSIDGKYLKFGPFAVDTITPTIENINVTSTISNYNSLNTNVKFTGTDNHSKTSELKMCISVDTSTCTSFKSYSSSSSLKLKGKYDGEERTIYITLKDKAGNIHIESKKYKVAITHKLTYNVNGGATNCSPTSKSITHDKEDGTTWGTLCTPKRTGYTFNGWNTKKDGTGTTITSDSTVSSDLTIYAQWKINSYKLSYNDNGGSGCSYENITKNYNSTWGTLCTPSRTGYTFNGWNTKKDGTGTAITSNSIVSNDLKVHAQWKINSYKLSYNDNGGSGCSSKNITKNYNSAWGTLCTPSRTGYTFDGWNTNANGTGTNVTSDTKATNNITIYAKWKVNTYVITFNGNGGTPSQNSKIITYNSQYGAMPTAYRNGYSFYGWYTSPGEGFNYIFYSNNYSDLKAAFGTNEGALRNHWLTYGISEGRQSSSANRNSNNTYTIQGNQTLYAQWKPSSAPTCSISASKGVDGDNGWYKTNVSLSLNTSGIVTSYGLTQGTNASNNQVASLNASEGNYTYTGIVSNEIGANTCQITIKLDKTKPKIKITAVNNENISLSDNCGKTTKCTVKYFNKHGAKMTASDSGSGIRDNSWGASSKAEKNSKCTPKESNWHGESVCTNPGDGNSWWCYTVKDVAGNKSNEVCSCYKKNTTSIVAPLDKNSCW